jgi:broad specificity phosphatase PhoE
MSDKTGSIIVIRHGPTHKEHVCQNEMRNIIGKIADYIKKNCNGKIHKILTSPYERCEQTTTFIMRELNMDVNKKESSIKLSRKQTFESLPESHDRGVAHGEYIRSECKNTGKNIILVTHSSILIDIIKGAANNNTIIKDYIYPCSLTIIQNDDIVVFNKGWSAHK